MGEMSVAEARGAWPDKALWPNFTSSEHLQPDEVIAAHTNTAPAACEQELAPSRR